MYLWQYNGVDFTTLGVVAPKFDDPSSPGPDRQVDAVPRIAAGPLPGGPVMGTQTLTALFIPDGSTTVEAAFQNVFAALRLDDPTPQTLMAIMVDDTVVETEAIVGTWRYQNVNVLAVDFVLTTPGWRTFGGVTMRPLSAATADFTITNALTGARDVLPTFRVYWPGTTQRSSSTADLGWKHRLGTGLTITNNGTEPLINQPYQIGPIRHKAIVTAGQGLASGNDLRVFCEGKELRRNVIGANTAACFVWVVLPTVAPGQSITLDIVTNNPSAGSPPTLTFSSTPGLPAMDIDGVSLQMTSYAAPVITFTGVSWETNEWAGGSIVLIKSGGSGFDQVRRILSNTATTITIDRNWVGSLTTSDTLTIMHSGFVGTGGIISSGTSTSVTDTGGVWRTNEYIGAWLEIMSGPAAGDRRQIVSNTATSATVSPAFSATPTSPNSFRIYQTNGARVWDVRQPAAGNLHTGSFPGLWQANKIQAPPTQVDFDHPASWYRFAYQPSNDAYSQPRYTSFTVGAGNLDHVTTMNIQRARRGRAGNQKEVGLADAIGVSTPFPISGIDFGYKIRNAKKAGSGTPGEGMCEARFMVQESGGELWSTFLSDVVVNNSTATVSPAWYDLTSYGAPNRIGMTLVPNGSDEVPQQDSNTAQLQSGGDYVYLSVNPSGSITDSVDWFTSPPTVTAVYDVHLLIRRGGATATPPYDRIQIGGPDHRIFVTGTNERIVIDCEGHTATLRDNSDVILKRIPWVMQVQQIVTDVDGTQRAIIAPRWLPIPPALIDFNGTYVSDPSGAGWGSLTISATGETGYWT